MKCTTCGEVWLATTEPDFDIPADPYLIAPPEPEPVEGPADAEIPQPVAAPEPGELRRRVRARAGRPGEQGRVVLWAGVVTLAVATVAVVVFYREIAQALEVALR